LSDHIHRSTVDAVRGEEICTSCGIVLDEKLFDYGVKPHQFGRENDTSEADSSTGSDPALHDFGLGSTFSWWEAPAEKRNEWRRLMRLSERARIRVGAGRWRDRSRRAAMFELDRLCECLDLPKSIQREAAYLYRKLEKARLTAGHDRRMVLAVLVNLACSRANAERTYEELVQAIKPDCPSATAGVLRRFARKFGEKLGYTTKERAPDTAPRDASKTDPRLNQIKFAESWWQFVEKPKEVFK